MAADLRAAVGRVILNAPVRHGQSQTPRVGKNPPSLSNDRRPEAGGHPGGCSFAVAKGLFNRHFGARHMKAVSWFSRLTVCCASVLVAEVKAQDVSVNDPVWFFPAAPPDELPRLKARVHPAYPNEMKNSSEQGYAILTRYVDATGFVRASDVEGTHIPFQWTVDRDRESWSMTAAKRAGRTVDGRVYIAVIFNPKSASLNGPNATPRLLVVAPVMADHSAPPGLSKVVPMRLKLDATGAIIQADPADEVREQGPMLDTIKNSLHHWRFAPARKNGRPVAAEVRIPVLCLSQRENESGNFSPPRYINLEFPEFPHGHFPSVHGEVHIDFEIDVDGRVKNPVIIESDIPALDELLLRSLRRWTFQPAMRDGLPVKVHHASKIIFGGDSRRANLDKINYVLAPSQVSAEGPCDAMPSWRGIRMPVPPYLFLTERNVGQARVEALIDESGKVVMTRVTEATRPEFGLALAAAVEGFTFDPALKDGKPVPFRFNFKQFFDPFDFPDIRRERIFALEKNHPERIADIRSLDSPLKPYSQLAPVFPTSLEANVLHGEALIELLIDTDGHAQLPRVVSASAPAFGYAAVQAASNWIFEEPKIKGKSAVVRARIPFLFDRPATPSRSELPPAPESAK